MLYRYVRFEKNCAPAGLTHFKTLHSAAKVCTPVQCAPLISNTALMSRNVKFAFNLCVWGPGGLDSKRRKGGKWPLFRGKFRPWDQKKVAAGCVRGVAVGEG